MRRTCRRKKIMKLPKHDRIVYSCGLSQGDVQKLCKYLGFRNRGSKSSPNFLSPEIESMYLKESAPNLSCVITRKILLQRSSTVDIVQSNGKTVKGSPFPKASIFSFSRARKLPSHKMFAARPSFDLQDSKTKVILRVHSKGKGLELFIHPGSLNVPKFLKKVQEGGFPAGVKRTLLKNVKKEAYRGPTFACLQLTKNVDTLLGKNFKKDHWTVFAVYGAGVFGLTLGVRPKGLRPGGGKALKIVVEEHIRDFENELKAHNKFAKAGLAPRPGEESRKSLCLRLHHG